MHDSAKENAKSFEAIEKCPVSGGYLIEKEVEKVIRGGANKRS